MLALVVVGAGGSGGGGAVAAAGGGDGLYPSGKPLLFWKAKLWRGSRTINRGQGGGGGGWWWW